MRILFQQPINNGTSTKFNDKTMNAEKGSLLQDSMLSITQEELAVFITGMVRSREEKTGSCFDCPVCTNEHWMAYPYPDRPGMPVIVASPIPSAQHRSVWYFPICCSRCGYAINLDASTVTKQILKLRECEK